MSLFWICTFALTATVFRPASLKVLSPILQRNPKSEALNNVKIQINNRRVAISIFVVVIRSCRWERDSVRHYDVGLPRPCLGIGIRSRNGSGKWIPVLFTSISISTAGSRWQNEAGGVRLRLNPPLPIVRCYWLCYLFRILPATSFPQMLLFRHGREETWQL